MTGYRRSPRIRPRSLVAADTVPSIAGAAPEQDLAADAPPSLWWPLARFAIPQSASAALQLLSGTVTAIYFGQLLGESALAVASVFFPIFFLLVSFLIGLISGGIILVARAHGADDPDGMRTAAGTTLCVCFWLSVAIAVIGYGFAPQLLGLLATPSDIVAPATDYARVTFLSLPLVTLVFAYAFLLRGTGDAKTPLIVMSVYFGTALLLTPALILGWGGLPKVGVTSAPWANIVACAISLPYLVVLLHKRDHALALRKDLIRRLRIDRKLVGPFFGLGIPGGLQTMVASLAEVAVITLVNSFGSSATAAYGAVNQVVGYLLAPMQAVGLAATVIAAQSIGAGRFGQLHGVVKTGAAMNVLVGAVSVTGLLSFAETILSWFVTDAATLAMAERALKLTLWSYVLVGVADVLVGVMRASGAVGWPTVIALSGIWLVQVPVAFVSSGTYGLDGVWMGYPAGFAAALAAQFVYFGLVWRQRGLPSRL